MLILSSNAVAIARLYMDLNGHMQIEIYQLLKPAQHVYKSFISLPNSLQTLGISQSCFLYIRMFLWFYKERRN